MTQFQIYGGAMRKYYLVRDEALVELNEEQIKQAKYGQLDYLIQDDLFGGVQSKVKRDSMFHGPGKQEDRILAETLSEEEQAQYASLSETDLKALLENTFKQMNQTVLERIKAKQMPDRGSTGIVALVESQSGRLTLANLGDSEVIAVHFNKDNEVKSVNTLNTLHQATQVQERERLVSLGYPPINDRIHGRLQLSRSFGDLKYIEYGLIDDPEMISYQPELDADDTLYYIVSSDGIRYGEGKDNDIIAELMKNNRHLELQQLAYRLSHLAIKANSNDNISILMTCIDSSKKTNQIQVLGVFDGHGGTSVSHYISMNFMELFKAELKKIVQLKVKDLSSEEQSQSSASTSSHSMFGKELDNKGKSKEEAPGEFKIETRIF